MNNLNIGPAYQYRAREALTSLVVFYSIMVIVMAAFIIGALKIRVNIDGNSYTAINGFGIAAMIFLFITGIESIREDLRVFMQNGISRRTTFVTQLLFAGSAAIVLAVLGEGLIKVSQLITRSDPSIIISDTYYMIFAEQNLLRNAFVVHLESVATYCVLFVCAYTAGVFVSLLFYRLNKIGTVAVAVGVPVSVLIGLPILISRLNISFSRPVAFILSHPWIHIAFYGMLILFGSLLNWLLLRRAPVKAAAG